MTLQRLLVFAPTRRAASETFVRANLVGLPFEVQAYFGDERPWNQPARLAYGLAVLLSKACTRLGLLRLAGWPAAVVAQARPLAPPPPYHPTWQHAPWRPGHSRLFHRRGVHWRATL